MGAFFAGRPSSGDRKKIAEHDIRITSLKGHGSLVFHAMLDLAYGRTGRDTYKSAPE
jgi:hypothetical protein